ncbi:MAG: bifunctional hydroxymethylpyrimidine kinase/phosphomethylpyrimidine kinase [Methanoregulaceae archaeon]
MAGTIAGSDCSGGAGIQADLKTFSALGVWGCTVVTAVTAQTGSGVTGIWKESPESVAAQLDAITGEFPVAAWKTGMLATRDIVRTVAGRLDSRVPLVIDPVLVASGGQALLDEDAVELFIRELVPKATLITPNLAEAAKLSGLGSLASDKDIIRAGDRILELGPEYVLIKGGHRATGDVTDILVGKETVRNYPGTRYPYDPHGTGCTLSAAITAYLARDNVPVEEAVFLGKQFVENAVRSAMRTRAGWQVHPGPV